MFSIAVLIYINIQLAIPLYLRKEKYFLYGVFVILSIMLLYITSSFFNAIVNNSLAISGLTIYDNSILLTYLFTGLRITFLSYLLYITMEWIDHKFLLQEIAIEKLQVERQYLKNQLNPHFLFNTLNNLHGLVLTDRDQASKTLLRFSDFMHYIVYTAEEKRIPLSQELQLLQDYIILEQLRLSEDKHIEFKVTVPDNTYSIAPLVLLPLAENAVKHGIQAFGKNAFAKINIMLKDNQLTMWVLNSQINQNTTKTKGIGLKNLKRRLELEYPGQHLLTAQDEKGVYSTHLQLTLDEI